jgi:hypothetical protein
MCLYVGSWFDRTYAFGVLGPKLGPVRCGSCDQDDNLCNRLC